MFGHSLGSILLWQLLPAEPLPGAQKTPNLRPQIPWKSCQEAESGTGSSLMCSHLPVVPPHFVSRGHAPTWRLLHGTKPPGLGSKRGQGKCPGFSIQKWLEFWEIGHNSGKKGDLRQSLTETLRSPEESNIGSSFVSPGLMVLDLRRGSLGEIPLQVP